MIRINLLAFIVVMSGCAAGPGVTGRTSDKATLEAAGNSRDETLRAVEDAPTSFVVPLANDRYAWERAQYFFNRHIPTPAGRTTVLTKVNGPVWSLSNRHLGAEVPYTYEVQKRQTQQGYAYMVRCLPQKGNTPSDALINAQNLARFINSGNLELSLLR